MIIPFRVDRVLNAIKHPWTEYQVTKAKRLHRKEHPECAVCGCMPTFFSRNNDVHHWDEPVHINPARACDPENLVTLCRLHHWLIGHLKNWKDWNANFWECLQQLKLVYNHTAKSGIKEAA